MTLPRPAKRSLPTLRRRGHELASTERQLEVLAAASVRDFEEVAGGPLRKAHPVTLQINVGRVCNQTCRHCHVDAGPDREEVMGDAVVEACLERVEDGTFSVLDITGGAPEMHPRFAEMVQRARAAGARVLDRCNLTILDVPRYRDLAGFMAQQGVEIVASLPWYEPQPTDVQRGEGVFARSMGVLRRLNNLGYGHQPRLPLRLVTNPVGTERLPHQGALESSWKTRLAEEHGVVFDELLVLNNMPVSRFLAHLVDQDELEGYLADLVQAFNRCAVEGLMCRDMVSVGYDGRLFDCDFNQMLDLELRSTVFELDVEQLEGMRVRTAPHCFGCTAGAGSSCGGALA